MNARLLLFYRCCSGASAAEYALVLCVVASALAVGALAMGGAIADAMNATADCLNDINNC